MKTNRIWVGMIAFLSAVFLLAPAAPAQAADASAFRSSRYIEESYSAYASAVPTGSERHAVEVFLQTLPAFSSASTIVSYNLYVDGSLQANIGPTQVGSPMPLAFYAEADLPAGIQSLALIPVRAEGGENPAEAINLMPEISAGSYVGTVGIVRNPNPEDRLNLRIAPDAKAESLRHYANGVAVHILAELPDGWVAVCIGADGGMARGYMKADFLAFGDEAALVTSAIPSHEAAVSSWSLYRFPEENSDVLATYGEGERFELLGESTAWWHIRVGEKTGFVRPDVLITPPPAEITAADLPDQGQRMVIIGQDGQAQGVQAEPSLAQAQAAPQAEVSGTQQGAALAYAAEARSNRGYTVNALVRSAGANQFDVIVHVLMDVDRGGDDSLAGFRLFAGDVPIGADAALDWVMNTSGSISICYRTQAMLLEAPSALRLVPIWEEGGAAEGEAIMLTAIE